jgi:hypothetical protein
MLAENMKGRCNLGDLGKDGRIMLTGILKKIGFKGVVDWVQLVEDRIQWCIPLKTVMNLLGF